MIDRVEIQSSDSAARLILSDPAPANSQKPLSYFTVTVEDDGLHASTRVYAYQSEHIAALFEDVAEHWRGWAGEKTASTIEGDFSLACTSDRLGHTFVQVCLFSGLTDRDWSAEAKLRLDAAQLDGIARSLRRFFRSEP